MAKPPMTPFSDPFEDKNDINDPVQGVAFTPGVPPSIRPIRKSSPRGQTALTGEVMVPAKPVSQAEAKRQAKAEGVLLTHKFTKDIRDLWEEQGQSIMRRAAFADPLGTMKVIASMLPKQIDVTQTQVEEIDNDKLDRLIDAVDGILGGRLGKAEGPVDRGEDEAAG
ncbi:hypothetical protein UFOVP6_10 [uncultured Caudovirales phage]|uniref:Uncharacterized protein n=1 Tax=uncultured Caudovirales phage TaxID=2100421 RepID=A0A6J5KI51_9CAUD|nr:hypothetical protein UFOVP6_10 [uncultured Caudovirales phage]